MQKLNCGRMPNTDFRYEEFEGLLASYYITLLPLKESTSKEDVGDFEQLELILNGFAERHRVQKPALAAKKPRNTQKSWGQPQDFGDCFSLVDMLSSVWKDFGVGYDPSTVDGKERYKFGRLVIGVLHRHKALAARLEKAGDAMVVTGIDTWNEGKEFLPFKDLIK